LKELAKTKNNHLTGKAPYKFESAFLQRRVSDEPCAFSTAPRARRDLPPSKWDMPREETGRRFEMAIGLQAGSASTRRGQEAALPTYCNDTIVRLPPAETPAIDRQMMRETGRRLVETYLKYPPLMMAS
jgi:hypothetical protein